MLENLDSRTRQALELDRLLGLMAGRARSIAGRGRILSLAPVELESAVARSRLVSECRLRMEQGAGGVALPNADPATWLGRLRASAIRLEPEEMRDAGQAIEASESARDELVKLDPEAWPGLSRIGRGLPDLSDLAQLFRRTFNDQGGLRDDASRDLATIRKRIAQLDSRLEARLAQLVRSLREYLAEDYVTLRHGRHVLPVRAEHQRKVSGLLHDQSGSGGTCFIEPFEVVELNNDRSAARLEEQAEVDRILRALTARLRDSLGSLEPAMEALTELDFLEALARTSRLWHARSPERSADSTLRLFDARHPLLLEQRGGDADVVPLSLELDDAFPGLLITGPNMGGKTVVLKTVGLLVFLAASGAHVPAGSASRLGEFEGMLADIGDAQSLERDLSTFAAHLERLDQMLDAAGPSTLVLCDELGTGTDPAEGAALSRAFLEALRERRARVLATSHLGALKVFAAGESGYRNASMEFEAATFRPTYRLHVGVPGRSHALEMAARLGKLSGLLARARELVGPEEREAAQLLGELNRLAREQAEASAQAGTEAARAAELTQELNRRIAELEARRTKTLDDARSEAARMVDDAENWAADFKAAARAKNREAMRELRQAMDARARDVRPAGRAGSAHAWTAGQKARAARLGAVVDVLSGAGPDGRVWVAREGLRIQVDAGELEPLADGALTPVPLDRVQLEGDRVMATELDLRGMTGEEAEEALGKALDDALLTGVHELRIIHGKGTGVLRKRVEQVLKGSSIVRSHRLGNWNEGGLGVTVADLSA